MKRIGLITLVVILSTFVITADAYGAPNHRPKPSHDVAVTNISAPSSCVQGDSVTVVVTVENQGNCSESFVVKLTDVTDGLKIGTQSVPLHPRNSLMDAVVDRIFDGEPNVTSRLGQSVVLGKDINADGYDDMIIGAPYYKEIQGRVYIYYGGKNATFDVPDLILTGEGDNNYFGHDIEMADFNNDNYTDVAITAPGYNSLEGRVYIYYGGPDFDTTADKVFDGEKGTNGAFGVEIAAGDINNDGCAELLVCAHEFNSKKGRVYLYYGAPDKDMDTICDLTFDGENKNDQFGRRMTAGGDVNGDNYDDVIIGAEYAPNGNAKGKAYLFYGARGITMDTIPDKIFIGEANGDRFGNAQLLVDIDKDGFADVIIGAPMWVGCQGRAYLYWGDTEANMDVNADVVFTGEGGRARSGLGDYIVCGYFNNDDYLDIVIGAFNYYKGDKRGKVYIFNGNRRVDMDEICDMTFIGMNKGSRFGNVLAVGDFNGDNYDDLAVGGRTYNNFQGRVWLYYGGPNKCLTDVTFNWDTIKSSTGEHTLKAEIVSVAGEEDTTDNSKTITVNVKLKVKEK